MLRSFVKCVMVLAKRPQCLLFSTVKVGMNILRGYFNCSTIVNWKTRKRSNTLKGSRRLGGGRHFATLSLIHIYRMHLISPDPSRWAVPLIRSVQSKYSLSNMPMKVLIRSWKETIFWSKKASITCEPNQPEQPTDPGWSTQPSCSWIIAQSTYICRVQSCVCHLPNYWPPTPSPPSDCVLPRTKGWGVLYTLARGWGGGQYFGRRQTWDWPLTV